MAETRTTVRLTNALDEALARRGRLRREEVRVCDADALVDPAAIRSVIPVHVLRKLGVEIRGQRVVQRAGAGNEAVSVSGPVIFDVLGRDTLDEALIVGREVVIGRTVLDKLGLRADDANARLVPRSGHAGQAPRTFREQSPIGPPDPNDEVDIGAIMRDGTLIDRAMAEAHRAALLDHKRTGDPIVVWENGRVVWIPAHEIRVDDD